MGDNTKNTLIHFLSALLGSFLAVLLWAAIVWFIIL
jgi:hypothetical protein